MKACEVQSLYFSDDGYVVCCKHCGHYQVAFMCIMISLPREDFPAFHRVVRQKMEEANDMASEQSKCIVIQTPAAGICFILTKSETRKFAKMLEDADNEIKAISLLNLFNS